MATEQKIGSSFGTHIGSNTTYERADFSSVEELELAARSVGWNIYYYQLRSGSFFGGFHGMQCDGVNLASEHFDNRLEIDNRPPVDQIGIFLPSLINCRATCCGRSLYDGDIIVLPADSELYVSADGECHNITLNLRQSDFEKAARTILGSDNPLFSSSAFVCRGDPAKVARFRQFIQSIEFRRQLDSEKASAILAEAILMIAEGTNFRHSEELTGAASSRIALKAQAYIEEHIGDTIRSEELCANAGASLRTLQRCFSAHFQVSPTEYIKARRLNAVHRILISSRPRENTVTNIAMTAGFYHLGRFSADYLAFFGEHPIDTLRRTEE